MYSAAAAADLGGDEAGRQPGGQLHLADRPPSASASLLPLAQRNDRNATRGFSIRRRNEAARCCAVNAPSQDKEAACAPAESALRTRKRSGSGQLPGVCAPPRRPEMCHSVRRKQSMDTGAHWCEANRWCPAGVFLERIHRR